MKILVSDDVSMKGVELLRENGYEVDVKKNLDEQGLIDCIGEYDGLITRSMPPVTEKVIEQIKADKYDMIMLNFANADMVGHTGVFEAAVKAVETVDTCVGKIVEALKPVQGQLLIIADHGNAEQMADPDTGCPYTAHTTNHVPCILVSEEHKGDHLHDGILADVAPTMLTLAGMDIPADMTGKCLLDQ